MKHDEGVGGVFRFFKSNDGYDTHVIPLFRVDNLLICGNLWISDNPTSHHYVSFIGIHNLTKKSDKVFFVREAISKIYFVSISVPSILN